MAADDLVKITEDSQERLVQYIQAASRLPQEGFQLRQRFELVDRAYQRENDFTEEQRKAKRANDTGNPTKLQNIQVPLVLEDVENTTSFLTNVYLMDYPMFKFGSGPDTQDLALMWNTLVGEDQVEFGWAGEFQKGFRNGEKYNFAPMEIDWKTEIKYKPANGSGANGVKLEEITKQGNCIRACDPYNTIYDARVPIYKNHLEGEFVGETDQLTRIQLKRFLHSLTGRMKNDRKAYESSIGEVTYYLPHINPDVILNIQNNSTGTFNWANWVTGQAQNHIKYKDMYTRVTLYARIMPFEFGINAPRDQTPDIWKLILINNVIVYAQPITNAHDILPIIIGQSIVDNLDQQTKAPAEIQIPFQDMVSSLFNAKLASARRRTTDRMLYNPLLVDPDHINSPNPSAKIPIRPTAYGRKLEEAVYQIPFNDANSQYFIQEANLVGEWGMRAGGNNRPTLGQFQKGNKLQGEWEDTMAHAGGRQRSKAITWEVFTMTPIKMIMKSNYLQYAPEGEKYNRAEQKTVRIDPVALRKAVQEFEIGDGLLPIQRLIGTDVMQNAFNSLSQIPGLAQAYNMAPMFSYLMKGQGVDKLSKFEKPQEQIEFEQKLAAWQNAVEPLVKAGKSAEEIQKTIGPMPLSPTEQKAAAQKQTTEQQLIGAQ